MNIREIAFTVYAVTDIKRARQFYEGALGLKVARLFGDDKAGWVEYDIGPNTLAIGGGSPEWKPSADGASVGLEVDDFQDALKSLKSGGVTFRMEPTETPVCHMASISDPDGNSIIIHKRKS